MNTNNLLTYVVIIAIIGSFFFWNNTPGNNKDKNTYSPFGYHHANGLQDYSEDLGIKWIRVVSPWGIVQNKDNIQKDIYDWNVIDNVILDYSKNTNFMITISLLGTPVEKSGSYIPNVGDYNKENYLKYVKELVLRYKDNIKYYQVENEPKVNIKDFAELQKITYQQIKEVCSDCYVLNGGFGYRTLSESDEILKELNGQYIDIFDFHYFGSYSETPEQTIKLMKVTLNSNNFNIPIWITETGTYSGDPETPGTDYQTEKQQASSLVKRYVSSIGAGADKIFWAWGIKEGFGSPDDGDYWDFTGLIYDGKLNSDQGNNVKKLSYYSYKKMTEILEGYNSIETIRDDNIKIYKFIKNNKIIYVAWSNSETQIDINLDNKNYLKIKAIPKYEFGKDVTSYSTAFNEESADNLININEIPIYLIEQ